MLIQVKTDSHVKGALGLEERVRSEVESTLGRFGEQLTRVDVSLNDVNGLKHSENDKRCVMEAKMAGMPPIAVSHEANTVNEAIDGAAEKLERTLDHRIGRLKQVHRGHHDEAEAEEV